MSLLRIIFTVILAVVWVYVLSVCHRAKLTGWFFIIGAIGSFFLLNLLFYDVLPNALAIAVTYPTKVIGDITEQYIAELSNGRLYLFFKNGRYVVPMNVESSGFTELAVFVSSVVFFKVYSVSERIFVTAFGGILVILLTSFRILFACVLVSLAGADLFYFIYNVIGRLIFFALLVLLYYMIFTRIHVNRIEIGNFNYDFD